MKPKGAAVGPPEYLSVTGGAPLRSPLRSPHPIFQRFSNVRFSEDDLAPLAAVASFQGSYKASTSVKQSSEASTSVKLSALFNPVRNYLPPGKEPKIGIKTFSCQKFGYFAKKDEIYSSPNRHFLTQIFCEYLFCLGSYRGPMDARGARGGLNLSFHPLRTPFCLRLDGTFK